MVQLRGGKIKKEKVFMDEKKNEIILFENQGVKLEANLKDETVWLTQEQMSKLFEKAKSTIISVEYRVKSQNGILFRKL